MMPRGPPERWKNKIIGKSMVGKWINGLIIIEHISDMSKGFCPNLAIFWYINLEAGVHYKVCLKSWPKMLPRHNSIRSSSSTVTTKQEL